MSRSPVTIDAMDQALTEMIERVRAATAKKTALRVRGGGSKDFYGQSLRGEVLETGALDGIISYEPSELVVTVRSGTPLATLEAALAERGQSLPFEPPHFGPATCGGMVACGLSGPARASAGAVKDFVLGLKLLNGRAELLTFGGQVMKNVAGYDVSRLMVGAMGTLGLITEISLKVLPVAVAESTLIFEMNEAQALAQLNRWGSQPLPINASCWFDGALMVRLRGARAAVAAATESMGGKVMEEGAQTLWQALREQTAPFFKVQEGESLLRLSVPDSAPALNLGPTLLEWGGAQRWIKVPNGESVELAASLRHISGQATIFKASDKSQSVFTPLLPPLDRIHRELKKQFDPAGIFNPGRMYADL